MSFTYYVIKNEVLSGKLKNDGSMIDYVYGRLQFPLIRTKRSKRKRRKQKRRK